MTAAEIARNAKALRNLAGRLERLGYTGDCYAEAEHIAVNLALDGWRPIEPPPPPRSAAELGGPGHREYQAARADLANRQKEAH